MQIQSHNPFVDFPLPDLSTMSSSPIHNHSTSPPLLQHSHNNSNKTTCNNGNNNILVKRERPSRACTARSADRLYAAAVAEADFVAASRKGKVARKVRPPPPPEDSPPRSESQCSKILTPLVGEPTPAQLPRWRIRSMGELASIFNFLNVFRPLLNINVEFSADELETALLTPNNTLGGIHIPLLKAIPPVTRMALGQNTWVTVLCRKLIDWWHWVADGELPLVASHGAEIEAYNTLDPGVRVVILKALCDIRVEQEDIRNYIDDSLKHGAYLSAFRKEHIAHDSGISYWYEDDPIIGQRLYREIRKVEVKKGKGKSVHPIPSSCYQWETAATNLDEFEDVTEKLFSSENRTEASLGKKLKIDMLPEIEKVHKSKERLLKKQHREALLLDSVISADGLGPGRSLRGRKPVSYTFDDYDRSINEAIKITKRKQPSPEFTRREFTKYDTSNGRWGDPSEFPQEVSFNTQSPKSPDFEDTDDHQKSEPVDRSNRWRQRPQRFSNREFVEAVSDFDSDDDIVGEVVYDEEYLRRRKFRGKISSSSEGDEEYHCDGENAEDEEEEEEEQEDLLSISEDSDEPKRFKKLSGRTRGGTKLRSAGGVQSSLRRSKRATRNSVDYKLYELSESETESMKPEKSNDSAEFSMGGEDSEENDKNLEIEVHLPVEEHFEAVENEQNQLLDKLNNSPEEEDKVGVVQKRRFLDLNELAPGSGFDEGSNSMIKDEDRDDL